MCERGSGEQGLGPEGPGFKSRRPDFPTSSYSTPSQRLQERDDGFLIALGQLTKTVGHAARFAPIRTMALGNVSDDINPANLTKRGVENEPSCYGRVM